MIVANSFLLLRQLIAELVVACASWKNPQACTILEHIHGVFDDMMCTSNLNMADTVTSKVVDNFIVNVAWTVSSTYHMVLRSTHGAVEFRRDILSDIPYLSDWKVVDNVETISR